MGWGWGWGRAHLGADCPFLGTNPLRALFRLHEWGWDWIELRSLRITLPQDKDIV